MKTSKMQVHITLGGTKDEFETIWGELSAEESALYDRIEQEISDTPEDMVIWIPSDF